MENVTFVKIVRNFATVGNVVEVFLLVAAVFMATPTRDSLFIGGIILSVGIVLHVYAMCSKKSFIRGEPMGPQKFLRHPILASQIFGVLGVIIAARSSLLFAIALIILSLVYRRRFEIEDRLLRQKLGPDFDLYHHAVPAVFPDVLNLFSWKHHEKNFFFGSYFSQENLKLKLESLASILAFLMIYFFRF